MGDFILDTKMWSLGFKSIPRQRVLGNGITILIPMFAVPPSPNRKTKYKVKMAKKCYFQCGSLE